MKDAHRKGRLKLNGENNPCAKLTNKEVKEIRKKYIPYEYGQKRLAKEYGVSFTAIRYIVIGKTWC